MKYKIVIGECDKCSRSAIPIVRIFTGEEMGVEFDLKLCESCLLRFVYELNNASKSEQLSVDDRLPFL